MARPGKRIVTTLIVLHLRWENFLHLYTLAIISIVRIGLRYHRHGHENQVAAATTGAANTMVIGFTSFLQMNIL
jgi:hypothetical protein